MRHALIAFALILPMPVFAQVSPETQNRCIVQGSAYQQVASYRDGGLSPQQTFIYMQKANYPGVDDALKKQIINRVYFDPGFTNAGGHALMMQMTEACMYPHGKYQPLK